MDPPPVFSGRRVAVHQGQERAGPRMQIGAHDLCYEAIAVRGDRRPVRERAQAREQFKLSGGPVAGDQEQRAVHRQLAVEQGRDLALRELVQAPNR
ncbi:hypothetical protein GCM10029992_36850 [Glycomyces albus]